MVKILISFILALAFLPLYSQGEFVPDKKTGKLTFHKQWNQYDKKLSVDSVINQGSRKWLIADGGKWGLFYSDRGLLLPAAYDTIIIFDEFHYGVLQDWKWSLFDSKGEMGPFIFDNLVSYSHGEAYVKLNGEWGYYEKGTFRKEHVYLSEPDEKPGFRDINNPNKILTDREVLELVSKNIKYPAVARENGIHGKVVVKVFISEYGDMDDYEIHESVHESVDNEVLRVLNEHLYLWNPGRHSGQAVPTSYHFPCRFRLE